MLKNWSQFNKIIVKEGELVLVPVPLQAGSPFLIVIQKSL
jgi:hypothetical protein